VTPARLDHLGVFVTDLAKSRAFYETHLGMEFVESEEDEAFSIVTLRAGAQEVHLFQARQGPTKPHVDHASWRVDARRFAELRAQLAAAGVEVHGPYRYKDSQFIKFADPDGLEWEYIAADGS
jgi:catechol 2,3-dioxygenase-like lactoylglutathione lyase family enzyme